MLSRLDTSMLKDEYDALCTVCTAHNRLCGLIGDYCSKTMTKIKIIIYFTCNNKNVNQIWTL